VRVQQWRMQARKGKQRADLLLDDSEVWQHLENEIRRLGPIEPALWKRTSYSTIVNRTHVHDDVIAFVYRDGTSPVYSVFTSQVFEFDLTVRLATRQSSETRSTSTSRCEVSVDIQRLTIDGNASSNNSTRRSYDQSTIVYRIRSNTGAQQHRKSSTERRFRSDQREHHDHRTRTIRGATARYDRMEQLSEVCMHDCCRMRVAWS
jgi:hypothetical protein